MRGAVAGAVAAFFLFSAVSPSPAAPPREPPPLRLSSETVPVARPGVPAQDNAIPIGALWRAESDFQAGRFEEALFRFLDLAYNFADDERKGFTWLRVGEILFAQGNHEAALSAAEKAVSLSGASSLLMDAMELKLRIFERAQMRADARQVALYLLEQGYRGSPRFRLHAAVARAEAAGGRLGPALAAFRQALSSDAPPAEAARLAAERDAAIEEAADIAALREAGETEEDLAVRAHLFLAMGRLAARRGFTGMAAYAFDRAARAGGPRGEDAAERLFRLEKVMAERRKIVGLAPLSGKYADIGFAVLSGAEVALAAAGAEAGAVPPVVIRWVDTGAEPQRARKGFTDYAGDKTVIGFLGPVTGEEGRSVAAAFGPKSPPLLYLGQKKVLDKPFFFHFGLTPLEEARVVFSHLVRRGLNNLLFFYPDNGYGRGFFEAAAAAAKETGARIGRSVLYTPGTRDFTAVIRNAVGNAAFDRGAALKEKGKGIRVPFGAIVIADRWERVFLLATQLRYYNILAPLAGFSGWNDEALIRKGGDAVAGSVFCVDYADAVPGSVGERFRGAYKQAMGRLPSRFEAMGYDGALLLREASGLETAQQYRTLGEAEREKIARLKEFRGATGSFRFGAAGDLRRRPFLLRIELGNFVPVAEP